MMNNYEVWAKDSEGKRHKFSVYGKKIDSNAKYIIAVDKHMLTQEDAYYLGKALRERMGIQGLVFMTDGNPNDSTAIYEVENK